MAVRHGHPTLQQHPFLDTHRLWSNAFTIWHLLTHQDALTVIRQLQAMFCEHSPPVKILMDNAPKPFQAFVDEWGVHIWYWCAYLPEGNGIAEQCHHAFKRIPGRTQSSLQEAAYCYNSTPKDDSTLSTAPVNGIYQYKQCVKGINALYQIISIKWKSVWVKALHSHCTSRFSKVRVDGLLVNRTPHYVKDLQPQYEASASEDSGNSTSPENDSDTLRVLATGSESPPADPENDNIGNEGGWENTGQGAMPIEISPHHLRRSTHWSWPWSGGECNIRENGLPPGRKQVPMCLAYKISQKENGSFTKWYISKLSPFPQDIFLHLCKFNLSFKLQKLLNKAT